MKICSHHNESKPKLVINFMIRLKTNVSFGEWKGQCDFLNITQAIQKEGWTHTRKFLYIHTWHNHMRMPMSLYISKSWNVVFIVTTLQLNHISIHIIIIFFSNFPIIFFLTFTLFFKKMFTLSLNFLSPLHFHLLTTLYLNITFHLLTTLPTIFYLTFSSPHYPLPSTLISLFVFLFIFLSFFVLSYSHTLTINFSFSLSFFTYFSLTKKDSLSLSLSLSLSQFFGVFFIFLASLL